MRKFLLATVVLGFSFAAQASVLDYHRSVLAPSIEDRVRVEAPNAEAKITKKTDIRSRLRARFLARRASVSSLRTNQSPTKQFKSQRLDFSVTVPADFSLMVDLLDSNQGEFILGSDIGDRIVIRATDQLCSGGRVAFFDCFRRYWQAQQADMLANHPGAKVLENRDLRWRNNVVSAQQTLPNNTGRFFLIEKGTMRHAQFLFQARNSEYLWTAEFSGPITGLLAENNGANRILNTMWADTTTVSQHRDRIKFSRALRDEKRVSITAPRTQKTLYSQKDVRVVEPAGVNFSIEVPRSFVVESDTLTDNAGELVIDDQLSAAEIKIWATEMQCNSQSPNVIQNCLRPHHQSIQSEFAEFRVGLRLLLDRSYGLSLTPEKRDRSDFAFYSLYRVDGKSQRYGFLTWREPISGHVWHAQIAAPEDFESLLSNDRKLNALITSMIYGKQ